jgi:hypothetical protein
MDISGQPPTPRASALHRAAPLLQSALMLALAFAALLPAIGNALNFYDEGLIVFGAERVLNGQIPYRDFWTMYGPGQLYVLAGLFRLFGASIMVERVFDLMVRAGLALAFYWLTARLSSREFATLTWIASVFWLAYFGFFGYPIFTALLFVTLSVLALIQSFSDRRWLIGGGLLLGAAALFRHDLAAYAFIAQFIVLAARAFTRQGTMALPARLWAAARAQAPYLVGLIVVVAPAALFFVATTPLNELLQQLIIFPLTVFPRFRVLPYPALELTLESLPFYAPFVIYAFAIAIVVLSVLAARRASVVSAATTAAGVPAAMPAVLDDASQARLWGIGLVVLFGLFAFNQARVRADLIHIPQFFLPAIVLAPVLMHRGPGVSANASSLTGLFAFVLLGALMVKPADYVATTTSAALNTTPAALSHGIPRAAGTQVMPDEAAAVRTIRFLVPPGQAIYSGVTRHDLIFVNDPMFYFLAERPPATRYHELHPGWATTLPVQQEIAAELERNNVQYLVLIDLEGWGKEPNESAISSGVTFLDDYIAGHYSIAQQTGMYRIMARR